jgi:hypothetical protein
MSDRTCAVLAATLFPAAVALGGLAIHMAFATGRLWSVAFSFGFAVLFMIVLYVSCIAQGPYDNA